MTRALLCGGLSALTLLFGILTALVQSQNRDKALQLNALKEECGMLEAINGDRAEQILTRDYGPLPRASTAIEAAKISVHASGASRPVSKRVATP